MENSPSIPHGLFFFPPACVPFTGSGNRRRKDGGLWEAGRTGGGLSFSEGWSFPPLIAGSMRKRRGLRPPAPFLEPDAKIRLVSDRPRTKRGCGGWGGRAVPRGASLLINAAGLFSRSKGQSVVSSLRMAPFRAGGPAEQRCCKGN